MWYEEFLGIPWAGIPDPPRTFNCGELLRFVFKRECGHECAPIPCRDARDLHGCLESMVPPFYGLVPVPAGEERDKDGVFMARRRFVDHCGLLVELPGGDRRVLHCSQLGGTQLSSFGELRAQGYTTFSFWRALPDGTEKQNV